MLAIKNLWASMLVMKNMIRKFSQQFVMYISRIYVIRILIKSLDYGTTIKRRLNSQGYGPSIKAGRLLATLAHMVTHISINRETCYVDCSLNQESLSGFQKIKKGRIVV